MKKMMSMILAAALMLATAALAQDAQTNGNERYSGQVTQVACSIQQADDGYIVYCFGQIFNNTDRVLAMDVGTLEIISGEQLLVNQNVERIWPSFINPGEHGYLYDVVHIVSEDGEPVAVPQVTALDYRIEYIDIDPAYGNIRLDVATQVSQLRDDGPLTLTCEVSNNSGADAVEPVIAYGLFTETGALVYTGGRRLEGIVIPDGQRVKVNFEAEVGFVEQWNSYNAKPTQAQVMAVYLNNQD